MLIYKKIILSITSKKIVNLSFLQHRALTKAITNRALIEIHEPFNDVFIMSPMSAGLAPHKRLLQIHDILIKVLLLALVPIPLHVIKVGVLDRYRQ